MATNDQYRVNKDTSARKNTKHDHMHCEAKVNALNKSHAAYLESIMGDYDAKIQSQEAEHEETIASLNMKHAEEKNTFLERLKAAVNESTAKVEERSAAEIKRLRSDIASLRAEKGTLETSLKDAFEAQKTASASSNSEITRLKSQMDNLKSAHKTKIGQMQRKVDANPNSWIQIHFLGRGRKKRTYYKKYNSTLDEAAEDLCKDIELKMDQLIFRRAQFDNLPLDRKKKLNEVCQYPRLSHRHGLLTPCD